MVLAISDRCEMKRNWITAAPLTAEAFSKFGDVIEKAGAHCYPINNGNCIRYHDLAKIEFAGPAARPLINIFSAKPCPMPLLLKLVERHPLGSQAFIPLSNDPFLVVACPDLDGKPGRPEAFVTSARQGINFRRNVWHGVLTPLYEPAEFVVIDRGGGGVNLEEYSFSDSFTIALAP